MNAVDKVKSLREQADKLEKAIAEDEIVTFSANSGGIFGVWCHIPKEDVISFNSEFAYATTANGDAYAETIILAGRNCGKDEKGRNIIRLKSGKVVYYSYVPGNASCFDRGVFESE